MLPGELADDFQLLETTPDDVSDVYSLIKAYESSVLGWSPTSREYVRAEVERDGDVYRRLVRTRSGRVAQSWTVIREPGSHYIQAGVVSAPDLETSTADALFGVALWDFRKWAGHLSGVEASDHILETGSLPEDAANVRRIEAAGFKHDRTFWDMAGPVAGAPNPEPVPGLEIVKGDAEVVHRIEQEAFVDHWGFYPQTFEEFMEAERGWPGYDPDQWWVAELESTPAALMTLNRRDDADRILYVQILGTLKEFRRRGIGSAMLRHAFDVAAAEGYETLSLHVDSTNETGAPSLYRQAGFDVRHAFNIYLKDFEPVA